MSKLPPWTMDSTGRMIYTISGDDPWEPQLTPGADLAKRKGCTCSRLDNRWGVGQPSYAPGDYFPSDVEFIVSPGCPLHDNRVESAGNREDQPPTHPNASPDELADHHAVDHRG